MAKQAKPTLPSGLDRGDLTYAFTSSPTTAHLASELTSRDGIRPIAYKWADQSQEVQDLITKVWKLEELSSDDLDKLPYEEYSRYLFDPRRRFDKPEALDGIRVLEVCRPDWSVFGLQFCGSLLAEHGAEVIKIEDPAKGDAMRWAGPPPDQGGAMKAEGENWPPHGTSLAGFCENRNKYSVTLDITSPQGREMFKDLARNVDVVIENYDPGFLDSLGIGYRQLSKINPKLIYAASNGPGQWGRDDLPRASYDILAQAMGGSVYITGHPDGEQLKVPIWVADYFGGATATLGILISLLFREKSGEGQMVENSQLEAITRFLGPGITWYGKTGNIQERYGNRHLWVCPDGIVKASDGYVAIGADDNACVSLWQCIGSKADGLADKYPTNVDRVSESAQDEIYGVIEEWAAGKTVAEIESLAKRHGFGACPVKNSEDACSQIHYEERGEIQQINDPWYGSLKTQGPVPLYSGTPGYIEVAGKPIGWDTEDVLRRFCGFTSERIKELEELHVIGKVAGAENLRDWW